MLFPLLINKTRQKPAGWLIVLIWCHILHDFKISRKCRAWHVILGRAMANKIYIVCCFFHFPSELSRVEGVVWRLNLSISTFESQLVQQTGSSVLSATCQTQRDRSLCVNIFAPCLICWYHFCMYTTPTRITWQTHGRLSPRRKEQLFNCWGCRLINFMGITPNASDFDVT